MGMVVLLIAIGLVLIALETVLPGMIAGILGFFLVSAGVARAYLDLGFRTGNSVLLVVMVLLIVGSVLWVKFFPGSPMARMFVSHGTIGTVGAEKPELLGQAGVAVTALRPSGTALFKGKRVDVVSEGSFIEKGQPINVVAIEGLRVVVRAADPV